MKKAELNLLIWLISAIECAGLTRDLLFDFVISPEAPTRNYLDVKLFEPIRIELDFGSTDDLFAQFLAIEAQTIWSNALRVYPDHDTFDFPPTCDRVVNSTSSFDHVLFVTSDADCQVPVQGHSCALHPVTKRPVGGVLHFCTSVLKQSDLQRTVREVGYLLGLDPTLRSSWHSSPVTQMTKKEITSSCHDLPDTVLQGNLVTPLALQVVANHLDCQELEGIPLEKSNDCLGDPQLLWNEKSVHPTPLALAMLEDSAWYKADYRIAETQTEGIGRGCDYFHEGNSRNHCRGEDCEYNTCDATHDKVIDCNDKGHCQVMTDCSSDEKIFAFTRQYHSTEEHPSRCFETNWGHGICLETVCDESRKVALVEVHGRQFECSREEEYHMFPDEDVLGFQCPPLKVLCPDFTCPSNCAGRGICEQDGCICFDSLNNNPMCTGTAAIPIVDPVPISLVEDPLNDESESSCGRNNTAMSIGYFIFVFLYIFLS